MWRHPGKILVSGVETYSFDCGHASVSKSCGVNGLGLESKTTGTAKAKLLQNQMPRQGLRSIGSHRYSIFYCCVKKKRVQLKHHS